MDLGFVRKNNWFRLRACAVIVRDNKILMCKNEVDDYFYSVGGAVRHGETVEDAVIREVFEETGKYLDIDRLLFIHQNFFDSDSTKSMLNQLNCHEISFYFLMKDNNENLISVEKAINGMLETTIWLAFNDFKTKKVYPDWLPQTLDNTEVKIITTREAK